DSDGNEFSLMDLLSIKDESVFRQVEQSVLSEKLNEILIATLTQREYTIIKYRFGLQGASVLTQLQTAEKLKISRSYISRIETKALKKLREKLKNEDLY
ncbi:MAG: sigma factor-like helix-turn-helix DNA-binding protein, partial [Clostridia bacterium]